MAKIEWDQTGERFYEAGVDRGVLYLPDGSAVPWNGLVSIQENLDGDASVPFHLDGVKYFDQQNAGDYLATLQAFTYPDEFLEFEGQTHIGHGIFAGEQQPKTFDLSYRTRIGNDLDQDLGYKIHVVYNLTAIPSDRTHRTLTNTPIPDVFQWEISAVPEAAQGYRPTAHIVFDTRYATKQFVQEIETMLYGGSEQDAAVPDLNDLIEYARGWQLIVITDHGDGSWSATGPDELITMLDPTTFQITEVDAVYLDANTYNVSSTA